MPASDHILNELSEISQTVAKIPDLPVFSVPENYFSSFPDKMLILIREDVSVETAMISPLLGSLNKNSPFKVPEGYFAGLEENLRKHALPDKQNNPAPVIQMFRRKQIWKLSVAAMITGLIGISAWLFFSQNVPVLPSSQVNLSTEWPKVSEEEMTNFLKTIPEMPQPETLQVAGLESLNVEDMLKDVQDGELQQFIAEMPDLQTDKLN
jgi:hypothetical protein